MKELRLTDRELQDMIAPALRARLRAAGFEPMHSDGAEPMGFSLPITLDLAGDVTLERNIDEGIWTFRQVAHGDLADRTDFAERAHREAVGHTVHAITKGYR